MIATQPKRLLAPLELYWHDLSEDCQQMLSAIQNEPSLKQLIAKHDFRAWQYTLLRQNGVIVDIAGEITLTEKARGWLKRYVKPQREAGDLVTITSMTHVVTGLRSRAWWRANTDSGYVLSLYIEDFKELAKAGYNLPDFNSRGIDVKVSIDVYVSGEICASGWRIGEIIEKK